MGLDVEVPDPPSLTDSIDPAEYEDATIAADEDETTDYRRGEIEGLLADGAWYDAFREWAADTDMDEAEYETAREMELFAEFDFFWDDFADRVGYHAPGIPEDWKERSYHPDLDSWKTVSSINAGLTEFGQLVCETLKSEYIDWEADYDAPDDLPDF
jgi:hypothetical protein